MPVKEHIRMTCLGTLPGNEIFSFGLSLAQDEGAFLSQLLDPNDTVWDDLRDDAITYWNSTGVSSRAKLTMVKFAPIGTDGRYSGPPVERAVDLANGGIAGSGGNVAVPNQIALAVTLHTEADLGRVKGRYYLPMPAALVNTDGRIDEAWRDSVETSAKTFIDNINNQPGLDVLALRVVVVSGGRHNDDGSVKLAHDNHVVTAVSVGRALDTIRRRRNKLSEFRGTPTAVASPN